ncbi:LysE family translocator [Actinosynnema sp. NPDC023658]|uniref:LysE family translocator n=1 Tax=Actinosynnema sp. NPDC023658 TaxID=3155465 RepID=UPI0033EA4D2C
MIDPEWALYLALFAVAATFTPGPNALLLLTVAARFGLRPAVPAALGVAIGIPSVIVVMGAGLGGVLDAVPRLRVVMHVLATLYICWLGWQILRMGPPGQTLPDDARPVTLWQAAALQWINPKVWTMAIGAIGAYGLEDRPIVGALLVGAVFAVVCVPAVSAWTLFGSALRRWLTSAVRLTVFKVAMGGALLVSIGLTWVT